MRERPSFVDWFMGLAFLAKERSHDSQTQVGSVIADSQNRILGIGYNGFPRGIDDSIFPDTRPGKYPFMAHSEMNALANCVIRPENGILYTLGYPCQSCAIALYQNGVRTWYIGDYHIQMVSDKESRENFDKLVEAAGINVVIVPLNFEWIEKAIEYGKNSQNRLSGYRERTCATTKKVGATC